MGIPDSVRSELIAPQFQPPHTQQCTPNPKRSTRHERRFSPPHDEGKRFLYYSRCKFTYWCHASVGRTPSIPTFPRFLCALRTISYAQFNHGDPSEGIDDRGRRERSQPPSANCSLFTLFRCTDTKPGVGRELSMTTNRPIGIPEWSLMIATTLIFYNVSCSVVWSLAFTEGTVSIHRW